MEELNERLPIRLPPFQLTRRQVLLDRLLYDPAVQEAAEAFGREHGQPRDVVMARVRRYAREIVPAFNAWFYFRLGYGIARRVARALYRVRLGYADQEGLAAISPKDSVVFVMNHRSNMDYVLVAYLAAARTALSYAVGEWARIWPLRTLVRALGAYFVRRNSGDPLYRKVLERYVQMATASGVTQAIYPEGGLSRDGRLGPPRLGLLDYILRAFDPAGERDVVFVPVGLNYDRVLEDRSLLLEHGGSAPRPGRLRSVANAFRFAGSQFWLLLRGRWHRFGYACVNFGSPISLKEWLARRGGDPRALSPQLRSPHTEGLARELMAAVGRVIPVLPVALVARALLDRDGAPAGALELKADVQRLIEELERRGARVYVPRQDRDYAVAVGLRMLVLRRLVAEQNGLYFAWAAEEPLLRYYANSIEHLRRP